MWEVEDWLIRLGWVDSKPNHQTREITAKHTECGPELVECEIPPLVPVTPAPVPV
jgi:hypothetical protein